MNEEDQGLAKNVNAHVREVIPYDYRVSEPTNAVCEPCELTALVVQLAWYQHHTCLQLPFEYIFAKNLKR